jgi:hypothetical protein
MGFFLHLWGAAILLCVWTACFEMDCRSVRMLANRLDDDNMGRGRDCYRTIVRKYPHTPLGRFLRVGVHP